MKDQQDRSSDRKDLAQGLPMFTASAPDVLAKEKAQLVEVEGKGLLRRWRVYGAKSGPGWLQSALVLGSGSAMASLYAGAYLQYKLLWVQPLAMALGIVMFAAMGYQTLSTGIRPFDAMKRRNRNTNNPTNTAPPITIRIIRATSIRSSRSV